MEEKCEYFFQVYSISSKKKEKHDASIGPKLRVEKRIFRGERKDFYSQDGNTNGTRITSRQDSTCSSDGENIAELSAFLSPPCKRKNPFYQSKITQIRRQTKWGRRDETWCEFNTSKRYIKEYRSRGRRGGWGCFFETSRIKKTHRENFNRKDRTELREREGK